jgi:hypothetical protein
MFHHLPALKFPELALLVKDMATGWVPEMVHRYPTAKRLGRRQARQEEKFLTWFVPKKRIVLAGVWMA